MQLFINFFDNINVESAKKFMVICSDLWNQNKPNEITVLFSSGGGFVNPGVSLYNFIKNFPCDIIMHNTGNIDSSAVVVFLGAKKRLASPSSLFLLHGITWNYGSGATRTQEQLAEDLSRLKEDEKRIAEILSINTALELSEVLSLFKQGSAKSPQFAKDKGIIQDVVEPNLSRDSQIFNI